MNRVSSPAPAEFAKATALTTAAAFAAAYVPFAAPVLAPFMALPLAYLAVRRGSYVLLAGAVVTGALVWLGAGAVDAVLAFVLVVSLGVTLVAGLKRSWTFRRMLLVGGGAATAAFAAWGASTWFLLGLDIGRVRSAVDSVIVSTTADLKLMGFGTDSIQTATAQFRAVMHAVPYLLPGLVIMTALLLAACSIGLAYRLFSRTGRIGVGRLALSSLRFHWSLAYLAIVGLALLLFPRGSGDVQNAVRFIGGNALLISQTLFFFQGLAVVRWFVVNRNVPRGQRGWLYFVALVAQVVTGILGLFDTWFDCRKRMAVKSPKPGRTD